MRLYYNIRRLDMFVIKGSKPVFGRRGLYEMILNWNEIYAVLAADNIQHIQQTINQTQSISLFKTNKVVHSKKVLES